jgi:predicted metal-dependent hydrolase
MTYVKSDIDNKFYLVRDVEDKQRAANMLGKINKNIIELSDKLYKDKDKYKDMEDIVEAIELFHSKAPNIILLESTQDSAYTSYAVNKGEQIVFCLRTKRTGNELHDLNMIMYVVLHELGHVGCRLYDNHGPLFRKIFAFLTTRAIEMGIYKKIDFRKNPEEYCGMELNESIV